MDVLKQSLGDLWQFPGKGQSNVQTLFIKGQTSKYIVPEKHEVIIKEYFPFFEILEIDGAGHWVHSEKPEEFTNALVSFFNQ